MYVTKARTVSGEMAVPEGFLFCSALQNARVLGKGVIDELLQAAAFVFLGWLSQFVVIPLYPPAAQTWSS